MERLIPPHGITVSYERALVRLRPRLAADFIESGCQRMQRNLSSSEWKEHVGDDPYRQTCANLPGLTGVTADGVGLR